MDGLPKRTQFFLRQGEPLSVPVANATTRIVQPVSAVREV